MEIIIKTFHSGNIHVNHYINSVFCWHCFKILSIFLNYLPLHHENFVIFLIGFSIYLFEVIFPKWWIMLVSKWTRLWTSSCHLMASRLETRLSKGYWWVRLLRCQARTIGSTNYYVSCVHSWADPHSHLFSLVILFLNYAERVLISKMIYPKKNWGLIFLIGMTIWY